MRKRTVTRSADGKPGRRRSHRKASSKTKSPVQPRADQPTGATSIDNALAAEEHTIDLKMLRVRITNLIGKAAIPMVEATIAQVNEGHYQPLKMLLELAGVASSDEVDGAEQEDSLAKVLLDRLGLEEGTSDQKPRNAQPMP